MKKRTQLVDFLRHKNVYGASTYLVASLFVFMATFGASVYYWYTSRQDLENNYTVAAEEAVTEVEKSISNRLQVYGDILRGGVGLFAASNEGVTREEWVAFMDNYDVGERYPGVQGFGVALYVREADRAAHTRSIRESGIPGYTIRPSGSRAIYAPLSYIAPYTTERRAFIGYDFYTDSARRQAMEEARDSGNAASTGWVTLVQSPDAPENNEPGFVIYVPIYKPNMPTATIAERRQAIYGFVYAPFRINKLMEGLMGRDDGQNIGIEIYDGTDTKPESRMYQSSNFSGIAAQHQPLVVRKTVAFSRHTWTINYAASRNILPERERGEPVANFVRGFLISIGFTLFVYYLLTNRTRKIARAKQQEVQHAKDELLALASHQLRTPATVVKQYVGMLLQGYAGELTSQQKDMLQSAYISNERQLSIINQILYVARLDAGQLKLQKQTCNISDLTRTAIKDHEGSIREHQQRLVTKIPRKSIIVDADQQYLHMALDNLVSNASKYTPEGGQITISLKAVGNMVEIRVADTGVGIAEEDIPKVFEKFSRVDNELSVQTSGSGIGLYLVRQIAELHGGTVEAMPNKPLGTVFVLRLPLKGDTIKMRVHKRTPNT